MKEVIDHRVALESRIRGFVYMHLDPAEDIEVVAKDFNRMMEEIFKENIDSLIQAGIEKGRKRGYSKGFDHGGLAATALQQQKYTPIVFALRDAQAAIDRVKYPATSFRIDEALTRLKAEPPKKEKK